MFIHYHSTCLTRTTFLSIVIQFLTHFNNISIKLFIRKEIFVYDFLFMKWLAFFNLLLCVLVNNLNFKFLTIDGPTYHAKLT